MLKSIADVVRIEVDLHKTIEMIVEQENVTLFLVLEQDNENEHVIKHVDIDASDILNLTYNLLPYTFFLFERMGGFFFCQFVIAIPSLIVVLKLLPHLPSPCEKVGVAFFWSKTLGNTLRLCK